MSELVHIAWDESFITETIAPQLGKVKYQGQATTKTYCKRSVPVAQVSNIDPNCPHCLAAAENFDYEAQMDSFGKYFYYNSALLQMMPVDFQEKVQPFIAAFELEKQSA